MGRFEGKVVVVTGAAGGIGSVTARLFAEEGAQVVAVDLDRTGLEALAGDEVIGTRITPFIVDVVNGVQVRNMVETVIGTLSKIDVLFNNAGIEETDSVTNTTEEMWDRQISVNVKSVFLCSKYVIPYMQKQGYGAIINTGSIEGVVAERYGAGYVASKGAVVMLTKEMAVTYAREGIRVNSVCPGWINTGMARRSIEIHGGMEVMIEEIKRLTPLERMGEPEEVAKVVLFLASSDASYITGHTMMVDGGYTAL